MPLFNKKPPIVTISGRPQPQPERPGTIQRRMRLFVECERRLADDPLARQEACGTPLGDGCGLEGLVARISPLFAAEPSLIRWVALRGAFAELFVRILDRSSAAALPQDLEEVMGLSWQGGPPGESRLGLASPWDGSLSAEQQRDAIGVAGSVLTRVGDYERYSGLNVQQVNADPGYARFGDAVALDCIAWSAIALLRLGIAQQLIPQVPEPDALPGPGWYTEPLYAKAERYWDGADWTGRCRVPNGSRFAETDVPLR